VIAINKLVYLLGILLVVSVFAGCGRQMTEQEYLQQQGELSQGGLFDDDDGPIELTSQAPSVKGADVTPFAIYNVNTGVTVRLGDKREEVEKTFIDARIIVEFEEDLVERVDYYDFAGIAIDYDTNDTVIAIRLDYRNRAGDWQIYNGVRPGNLIEQVLENYPPEHVGRYSPNSRIVTYDANGNSGRRSETAPYRVRFNNRADDDKLEMIVIEPNYND